MGGNAFHQLESKAFPRIPPAVYNAVKERLLPHIRSLYEHVAVPVEAPEKTDHGDIDFVVASAKIVGDVGEGKAEDGDGVAVPHGLVKAALGARLANEMGGNRTSNFAVPISRGEWASLGHAREEEERRNEVADGELFYQVDVHVCADEAEWERVVFFHGYGDLGMIMGLIARNNGLLLGTKGLKVYNPPNPPFELSENFDDILPFLGLSMDRWKAGFDTKEDVFKWVTCTPLFNSRRLRIEGEGISKVKAERKMYAQFVQWATRDREPGAPIVRNTDEDKAKVVQDALVYFHKKEAFDQLAKERSSRQSLKKGFNGSLVRDWTGLGGYWVGVKMVTDGVRERLGGDEGIIKFLGEEGEERLKQVTLEVRDQLGLVPRGDADKLAEKMSEISVADS